MKKIRFVLIKKNNIEIAVKIAKKIFPYELTKNGIFLPEKDYETGLKNKNKAHFYIVKYGNENVGITGFNFNFYRPKSNELWIGYFGIIEKYRGNGIGKRILLKTIEEAKIFCSGLQAIKLYSDNRKEEKGAHFLYKCVGFKIYAKRNTKPFQTYYFKLTL